MSAYAIAHLRHVEWGPDIVTYIQEITDTLDAHGGRFLVHGDNPVVMEGPFPGHLVVIEFPSMDQARAWYQSDAYQAILPLRTQNADGATVLVQGVAPGYRASELLAKH
ncbi:MAG: DUF1330 domain-containing protein [Comamonadaceae bacterium]|jgi:uncharacterized protein (DUF1330 family)|uniref:DUF1330 domain-containing protein n=1 Tax=Hydrogenophaga borbori TaxID=2294117 RepID=A0A372EPC2_9BURK|nr:MULTISPECIES: DUF1330 domain-containing protein [Hydrogenophaga]NCT95760.1 DUF1330 domain-containing protein [Comamonadaceae bacterium]RFP82483.1 DUF1330 domain-containing protein [Hydrogenophaga borbori]WQB82059.1 DUF1330 domain-containing protein [Hydrogenophaga sp. SNF1]